MPKGNKKLGDLDVLNELDGDVDSFADGVEADDNGTGNVDVVTGPVQIKYVCSNTVVGTLQRVGTGYALRSKGHNVIRRGETKNVETGIEIQIPKGYRGRLDISNTGLNRHLIPAGGVIESGNHNIVVKVTNRTHDTKPFELPAGAVVAILYIEKVPDVQLLQVHSLKTTFAQANQLNQFDDSFPRFAAANGGSTRVLGGVMSRNK